MIDNIYLESLMSIRNIGMNVTCRGRETLELRGRQTKLYMERPVITIPERNLGYRFMAAEAAWMLSGDNRVSSIKDYSKTIHQYSDNGVFYFGSYGVKFVDQVSYIVDALAKDHFSRQAYVNLWREQPRDTRDVPCTTGIQWMIREGRLHCFSTMRSNDMWLGWPYDVFNMSMLSMGILLLLRDLHMMEDLKLGTLYLTAASQHIYMDDVKKIDKLLDHWTKNSLDTIPTMEFRHKSFGGYEDLVEHLRYASNCKDKDVTFKLLTNGLYIKGGLDVEQEGEVSGHNPFKHREGP